MIDWDATKELFGYGRLPKSKRPKVICICDECGKSKEITIRVKSRVVDGQIDWLCPSCVKLRDGDKISLQMRQQWNNANYRENIRNSSRKIWLLDEFRNKHSVAVKDAMCDVDMSSILRERYSDKSARDKLRKISCNLWKDDEFRAKVATGIQNSAVLNGAPSSLHTVFSGLIEDLGIVSQPEFQVGPYNFDFCLFPPDRKKILVEIHGDYWHNRADSIARDNRKSTYAKYLANDFDFLVFWEFEFYTKNRVADRLKEFLGFTEVVNLDFDFNDIELRAIDAKEARVFLTQYHYSGSLGRGGAKFGAYLNDKLVAVAVYSSVTRKETATRLGYKTKDVVEISRFCIHPSYHKRNFASWFLSRCNKKVECKCLVAFADTTFGHCGGIYKASNFELDGMVKPTYWYIDTNGWVMHKKTLYEHARSIRLTEREFAEKYKYNKIFGAEKYRYIKRL